MRNVLGGFMVAVGMIGMAVIWLYTTFIFFADGNTGLGLIALLIPPADLVLPFLISAQLGVIGIGVTIVAMAGFAIQKD